jgi:hypothetical protein
MSFLGLEDDPYREIGDSDAEVHNTANKDYLTDSCDLFVTGVLSTNHKPVQSTDVHREPINGKGSLNHVNFLV